MRSKADHDTLLEEEAKAFDRQILERIRNGHVPDLRRAGRCEWFRNNVWRDAAYADLLFGEIVRNVVKASDRYSGKPRRQVNILEIACGPGHVSLELSRNGFNVTGMDISAQCVEIARRVAEEDPDVQSRGPLRYIQGDFHTHEPDRRYDLAVFSCALHHFGDVAGTVARVRDILTPGGILFVCDPTKIRLTDAEAGFVHLVRGLLSLGGSYHEDITLPATEEDLQSRLAAIQDEFDYKDAHGENVQSPLDNEAGYADMYPAMREHFDELETGPDFAFFDRVIGGLRLGSPEREREAARWIKRMDKFLCEKGFITPEQFHFIGRAKMVVTGERG